jgi:hypothetical protein
LHIGSFYTLDEFFYEIVLVQWYDNVIS